MKEFLHPFKFESDNQRIGYYTVVRRSDGKVLGQVRKTYRGWAAIGPEYKIPILCRTRKQAGKHLYKGV